MILWLSRGTMSFLFTLCCHVRRGFPLEWRLREFLPGKIFEILRNGRRWALLHIWSDKVVFMHGFCSFTGWILYQQFLNLSHSTFWSDLLSHHITSHPSTSIRQFSASNSTIIIPVAVKRHRFSKSTWLPPWSTNVCKSTLCSQTLMLICYFTPWLMLAIAYIALTFSR